MVMVGTIGQWGYGCRGSGRSEAGTRAQPAARRRTAFDGMVHLATPDQPPWRLLPPVLALAFAVRAAVALNGDFVLHADEVMQYREPAHRLVFGNGVIYWECFYGARSWLVPGVLKLFDLAGLGEPLWYHPAVAADRVGSCCTNGGVGRRAAACTRRRRGVDAAGRGTVRGGVMRGHAEGAAGPSAGVSRLVGRGHTVRLRAQAGSALRRVPLPGACAGSRRGVGQEQLRTSGGTAGFAVLAFWRWALSGLSCNTTRGVVAEFIVAQAVGGATGVRDPWAAYDVTAADGITRIEVKARAYLQCWPSNPKSPAAFEFSATKPWSCELGRDTSKKTGAQRRCIRCGAIGNSRPCSS